MRISRTLFATLSCLALPFASSSASAQPQPPSGTQQPAPTPPSPSPAAPPVGAQPSPTPPGFLPAPAPPNPGPFPSGQAAAPASNAPPPSPNAPTGTGTNASGSTSGSAGWGFATGATSTTSATGAGAVSSPFADTAAPASKAPDADAEALLRDAGLHEMLTLAGSTGLLRVANATSAPPGTFRLQALWEYFTASDFLCNSTTPCGGRYQNSSFTAGDTNRFGATFGLSATLTKFLEAYGSIHSYANGFAANGATAADLPKLLQVLGDTTLGAKVFLPTAPYRTFNFGADLQLLLLNGVGGVGLNSNSTSARFRAMMTTDFRKPQGGAPILVHLNAGYRFDNSGAIVQDVETARGGHPISRVERFGLGINRVDFIELGLGVEGVFHGGKAVRWVRPFVEYTVDVPTNRQSYTCNIDHVGLGDLCLGLNSSFSVIPSRVSAGVRVNPFLKGLMATAAFDVGLSGTSTFVEELSPQPPWTAWLGIGYSIDTVEAAAPLAPPPAPMEHAAPASTSFVQGFVHEAGKSEGIANAIVRFEGRDINGIVTDTAGRFRTINLEPGQVTFSIKADGYKDGTCSTTVSAPGASGSEAPVPPSAAPASNPFGETSTASPAPLSNDKAAQVDCALEAMPRAGSVTGKLTDATGGAAVINATVIVTDATGKEHSATTDTSGAFRIEGLPPGTAKIRISSNDYLSAIGSADIKAHEEGRVALSLHKRPKNPNAFLSGKEITLRQQVHFEGDTAKILPDSISLLEEIADVLNRTPRIKLIEIQGHMDNSGSATTIRLVSEQRANAVRDQLITDGVSSSRLQAKGYGSDRPLVPNVTSTNRARNRRISLLILEQDKETKESPDTKNGKNPSTL